MPLTFSHPAFVLPLTKYNRWISTSGLLIGSMSPDFEYFFRLKFYAGFGHTVPGIFYFCLPVSLILVYIFQKYIRQPLIKNSPYAFQRYFKTKKAFSGFTVKNLSRIGVSIVLGAASHISFDHLTHNYGYYVVRFPFLRASASFLGLEMPTYQFLHYLGSVIGIFIFIGFGIAIFLRYRNKTHLKENPLNGLNYTFWSKVLSFSFIYSVLIVLLPIGYGTEYLHWKYFFALVDGFCLGLLSMSVLKPSTNY